MLNCRTAWLFCIYCVLETLAENVEGLVRQNMRENLNGDVEGIIRRFDLNSINYYRGPQDNSVLSEKNGVFFAPPALSELDEYERLKETLSFSNKDLGIGRVKGREKAERWKNNRMSGFIIPEGHPRHNASNCVAASRQSGESPTPLYRDWRHAHSPFYLYKLKNGFIDHNGIVEVDGGYVQFRSQCETKLLQKGRKFHESIQRSIYNLQRLKNKNSIAWDSFFSGDEFEGVKLHVLRRNNITLPAMKEEVFNRVFVITAMWDYNYHHFLHDSVSRLIRFLPFLQENEDVHIHVREFEKKDSKLHRVTKGMPMREKIFKLLGLDPKRIIARSVRAKEIYLPREIGCNFALKHALEMRQLSSVLMQRAQSYSAGKCDPITHPGGNFIIVMERHCLPHQLTWRCLNGTDFRAFKSALSTKYPGYTIVSTEEFRHNSDPDLTMRLACDIIEFSNGNILVGTHGAGFTNMMFMREGGMLIEIVGEFDGRMLPLCGYHGPLGSIFGLHHYIHYYDFFGNGTLNLDVLAKQSASLYMMVHK